MEASEKAILQKLADTVRGLSIDAIQAANSGHPGLPLGCAEIGACLYGRRLAHNPANPDWFGRDRFVLSAGHGSALLYSLLHLSGYDLPMEELKNFRQLGSKTPGHPEYGEAPGVETTTGPLGQGLATAAGMALGNRMAAARLGLEGKGLLDGQVFVLAGDGCMMEGITNEASSLAGHLKLDNLVVIYDSNDICLDGPTCECFTEDTEARYRALGWAVTTIDGHDLEAIDQALAEARARTGAPSLIVAKTTIGKGSPNKAGTSSVHGSPLGDEEAALTKKALGLPEEAFFVPEEVSRYMQGRLATLAAAEAAWSENLDAWRSENPEGGRLWDALAGKSLPGDLDEKLRSLEIAPNSPGRKSSSSVLQALHSLVPSVVGGSADLSCSDNTMMKGSGVVTAEDMAQRNIKFGVREFAAGAMTSGLCLQGMYRPFCGTFLVFSDYMRNAIRLAALMKLRTVYQFTHDSIFLGEDGPTHQPVEHLASLRAMPNLTVIRPADANEARAAWSWALRKAEGPVAMILTRQNLPDLEGAARPTDEGLGRGGYVVKQEANADRLDVCLCASGSEVSLALDVATSLEEGGLSARVVSIPSFEILDGQGAAYLDSLIPTDARLCVSIEAAVSMGWHKYIGRDGLAVSIESFGASAPGKQAGAHFGFEKSAIVERIRQRLNG